MQAQKGYAWPTVPGKVSTRDKFDAGPFHSKTSVLDHYMAISQPRHVRVHSKLSPSTLACVSGLLPPLFHLPAGQGRLLPGCLVLRSTRNLIKRVRIPQEHIILLLGSAPIPPQLRPDPWPQSQVGLGSSYYPGTHGLNRSSSLLFFWGKAFQSSKNMMGMIYISGF